MRKFLFSIMIIRINPNFLIISAFLPVPLPVCLRSSVPGKQTACFSHKKEPAPFGAGSCLKVHYLISYIPLTPSLRLM